MITLYGAAPFPESPRIGDEMPWTPGDISVTIPAFTPPTATPRGPEVDDVVMTHETIAEVEAYCAAMVRFLSLPREQRAAVERWVDAARKLTGRVEPDAGIYQLASRLAGGVK